MKTNTSHFVAGFVDFRDSDMFNFFYESYPTAEAAKDAIDSDADQMVDNHEGWKKRWVKPETLDCCEVRDENKKLICRWQYCRIPSLPM